MPEPSQEQQQFQKKTYANARYSPKGYNVCDDLGGALRRSRKIESFFIALANILSYPATNRPRGCLEKLIFDSHSTLPN